MQLLAYDLLTATYWLDVRKAEDPKRDFGPAPTAAWSCIPQGVAVAAGARQPPRYPLWRRCVSLLEANTGSEFLRGRTGDACNRVDGDAAQRALDRV